MNELAKLLRDTIVFVPLAILAFGMVFSLVSLWANNESALQVGLLISIYGLMASYVRQIYKDYVSFLKEEKFPKKRLKEWSDEEWKQLLSSYPSYLQTWRKFHARYYGAQFMLLMVFVYFVVCKFFN